MYYQFDKDGRYQGSVVNSVDVGLEFGITDLPPPRPTDYWSGSEWINRGVAPSINHLFNYETKQWFDHRPLAVAKQDKWDELKLKRNQVEFGGFNYLGHPFDSDQISQVRIIAAVVIGQPITWTTATDEAIDLDTEQLKGLGVALANHVTGTHARGRMARKLIEMAATHDEVAAVIL